ncbi:Homeobox-like domain superfamily [Arabidopsis thaliana x Arabidopsis arenosa]|uniref:Homeobox-like domain superfamily n=1 Tax=Arabidopsis thaliana x Arabidopsis arenosa TaxID=1240361 RepID=A0A8T2F9Y0_9BRAS|nr:Homeobox-like domain superfamily [Arabidopsis thaliana x Arabidopsis arenosa]
MVDCGVDIYQLPVVPRACRSPRGRRLKIMRKQRSEFEVLAQVAGRFSGERKNRIVIGSLAHETKETKDDNVVVNNFLETMEVEVKPQPGLENLSQVLLSKDWLALGPSMPNSPITQEENFDSRSKIVKFGIKSLNISELLVDVPESATVGSLKLAVLEAVTQILKDGLNIGVLFQGKTIVDDSKTLLQIGIPYDDDDDENLGSLGFMLEPQKSETTTITTLTTVSPRTRLRQNQVLGSVDSTEAVAAKSVVPVRMKPAWQPEMVQRRIRRPFTVSEVEALVQAVERLGTGRWRDVKSHAFNHVNHRTYVDLKDKWKTLVHTAKISARQRRGEPVPQDLLDRVLAAHAFWSDRTG